MQRFTLSALLLASLAPLATAQDLTLTVEGGSYPGMLTIKQGPGSPGKATAVLISITTGPTPLALIDRNDTRSLCVGTELLGLSLRGVFLPPSNMFSPPPIMVPNNPGFDGATIHWQGIDFPGTTTIVDRISNNTSTRFGPANNWRDRNVKLNTARSFGEVLPIGNNGEWMVTGGGQGGILAQIALKSSEIYDIKNDAWKAGPAMQTEHTLFQATELADGKWLISGGLDFQQRPQDAAEVWDPKAKQFTLTAAMTSKRSGHRAVRLPNGKVLAMGGFSLPAQPGNFLTILNSTLKSTEMWDPATGKWTAGPDLSEPRSSMEVFELPNNKFLICGGVSWFIHPQLNIKIPTIVKTTDILDANTMKVTAGPPMGHPHAAFAHAALGGGKYLVAGGGESISLTNPGKATAKAEIYDAATNKWTFVNDMAEPHAFGDVFPLAGGKAIMVGGFKGDLVASIGLKTTEILDVATGKWTQGPDMPRAAAAYTPHHMPSGQIQLIGGQDSKQLAIFESILYYR